MAKRNNFNTASLSFEDFEKSLAAGDSDLSVDELAARGRADDLAARKKEAELKKAYERKKRLARGKR